MIYLASPYTNNINWNFEKTEAIVAEMMKAGLPVFSPIVHNHSIAEKYDLPKDYEFWKGYNRAILCKAAQLYILTLPSWEISRGVQDEIAFAKELHIPQMFVHPDNWS